MPTESEPTMKAIVQPRYGSPDVLELREVTRPTPKPDEVLVRVRASSVNAADLDYLRGIFLVRLGAPRRPAHRISGTDVAGEVVAVGADATRFREGDAVYGDLSEHGFGAFAEYVAAPELALAPKPEAMSFEEAATLPQAAVLALQGLTDHWPVTPRQSVLVNGAGGGVGTFAVQIARAIGAEVTGVDRAEKLALVRSLGADHVIDHELEDYTRRGARYDRIIDVVAQRSAFDYRRALHPRGVFLMVGGPTPRILQTFLLGLLMSAADSVTLGLLIWKPNRHQDAEILSELYVGGAMKPVIERTYPLEEVPDALRHLATGTVGGKLAISVAP